jgi:hypothetical protein
LHAPSARTHAPDDYPEDADEARELGLIVEDDPLYDDEMDDRDEKWVQKRFSTPHPRHDVSAFSECNSLLCATS